MSAQVENISSEGNLEDQYAATSCGTKFQSGVREIKEGVNAMLREPECATQITMLFEVGRKTDELKVLLREMKTNCDAGKVSKLEFEETEREFQLVREWASDSISPLFDFFFRQYSLQIANTPKLMEQVNGVRHEVFCSELGFYQPSKTEYRKEIDDYDPVSWHVLLTRADEPDRGIGCIRVIPLSPTSDPDVPNHQLPIFKLYKDKFKSHDPSEYVREKICEVSRLSILSEYRATRSSGPIKRLVTLALPVAAYVVGIHYGMEYAYQICAPPFVEYLSKTLGAPLIPIGEPFDYHGTRLPTALHAPSSVQSFDLIPYTFYRLLKLQLFPDSIPKESLLNDVQAK